MSYTAARALALRGGICKLTTKVSFAHNVKIYFIALQRKS